MEAYGVHTLPLGKERGGEERRGEGRRKKEKEKMSLSRLSLLKIETASRTPSAFITRP